MDVPDHLSFESGLRVFLLAKIQSNAFNKSSILIKLEFEAHSGHVASRLQRFNEQMERTEYLQVIKLIYPINFIRFLATNLMHLVNGRIRVD